MYRWLTIRTQLLILALLPVVAGAVMFGVALRRTPAIEAGPLTLAGLAYLVTAAASVAFAQQLASRLRLATRLAHEVADRSLPVAIDRSLAGGPRPPNTMDIADEGIDELASMSAAFNTIQRAAVDQAIGHHRLQQVLDTTLAATRRNRRLAEQLQRSVEQLAEADEADAMFAMRRVDQLALQIARGTDSVLVLAGNEISRSASGPTQMAELVQEAVDEVDGNSRVQLHQIEPIDVESAACGPLVHALAELIDNALQFSSPTSVVVVKGQVTKGGYHLAVVDEGVGMSAVFIEQVNRQLTSGGKEGSAPLGSLGHSVVARLARQLDTRIRLITNVTGTGITANVLMPSPLFVDQRARTLAEALGSRNDALFGLTPASRTAAQFDDQESPR